jgi:4-diphosphocytidyl-2-C-methyl-D-erythritol kinase
VQGANNDNLVAKAYRLLQGKYADRIRPLEVWLYKKIPMGAGLGGGSADAAFMLRMLNEYFELALSEEELAALALQLGSDCPFFIYNTPQFAKGRGEAMSPMALDLSGYKIRLICPHVHVSTAAAFGMIHPKPALFDLSRLQESPVTSWREVVVNDFEEPVFAMHPNLRDLKDQLYEQGAVYASMSGSGSALYGIYKSDATIYPLTSQVALDEYILDV